MELDELKQQLNAVDGARDEAEGDQMLDQFMSKFGGRFNNDQSVGALLMNELSSNGIDVSLLDQAVEHGLEQITAELTAEAQAIINLFNSGKQAAMQLEQKVEGIKDAMESVIAQQNADAGELPATTADEIAANMPSPGMADGTVMNDTGMPAPDMSADPNAGMPAPDMSADPNAGMPEPDMSADPNAGMALPDNEALSDRRRKVLLEARYAVSDRRKKAIVAPANNANTVSGTKLNTAFINACGGGY